MKQKQRAAAPHFYVSPTALFYFCPVRILFLQLSEQSFLLMFLALRCNSVHGIVKLAKRFLLCLGHALRNLYHQRHEMVAAHVAVTQGRNTFSFQTDSRICLGSRFDLILYLAVHRLDADRTAECCFHEGNRHG